MLNSSWPPPAIHRSISSIARNSMERRLASKARATWLGFRSWTGRRVTSGGAERAIARELVERGAKVYAGARNPCSVTDPEVIPVQLDITDAAEVAGAARLCADASIIINNAGVSTRTSPLSGDNLDDARREV